MIKELRVQLSAELSDRSVLGWFVHKYRSIILSSPIRGGFDNVAWIVPPVVGVFAFAAVLLIIQSWSKQMGGTPQQACLPENSETMARIRRDTAF